MNSELTILLPAFNEENSIGYVIDEVRKFSPKNSIIMVVDSNSIDNTQKISKEKGATVVNIEGRGKGKAVRGAILRIQTEYVIMMDSDYTYPAKYIPEIFSRLRHGSDVILCNRHQRAKKAMSGLNRFGNFSLSLIASLLYGYPVNDVCTGMWGFKTDKLMRFNLTQDGFALEADMFINAMNHKCSVSQIPIAYRARFDGSRPKLKFSDGFEIGWFLIKSRFRRN